MKKNYNKWLVLDCHYLCHRAFHTSRHLSYDGTPTGIIFGFLQSVSYLKDEFQTDRVVFCFEHKKLYRRDIFKDYKVKRKNKQMTKEEKEDYRQFAVQIRQLKNEYLPMIGFRNVFSFTGMESDDIMAAIAFNKDKGDVVVLITADSDMYQCLGDGVVIHNPVNKKTFTERWFRKHYGFPPAHWSVVKSIAGCSSDNVPGIRGIGEITACRYLRGELNPSSKAYKSIINPDSHELIKRNKKLVKLPFKNCPVPELTDDHVTKKKWLDVCSMLGMRTLKRRAPIITKKMA